MQTKFDYTDFCVVPSIFVRVEKESPQMDIVFLLCGATAIRSLSAEHR